MIAGAAFGTVLDWHIRDDLLIPVFIEERKNSAPRILGWGAGEVAALGMIAAVSLGKRPALQPYAAVFGVVVEMVALITLCAGHAAPYL